MAQSQATKTLIQRLESRHLDWFKSTEDLYQQVTGFYLLLLLDKTSLLELSQKEALSQLERLTIVGIDRPSPEFLLPWDIPMLLRRAGINQAYGAAKSFYTTYQKWQRRKADSLANGKKFTDRPPVPPRQWNWKPTFYSGMYKNYTGDTIMLKLWTGKSWAWVKFRLHGRQIPSGWKRGCPKAIVKGQRIELHFPVELEFSRPQKAALQAKNPGLKICAVDLNINENLAVCTILDSNGNQVATQFIKGGDNLERRRKRCLGKVAIKRRQTGIIAEAEVDNKAWWAKIRHIDDYEAHRISRRIVDFAISQGAKIVVFEHLSHFKSQKGKYSKRGNSKRAYWLRGKIYNYAKYKAWFNGLLTCRVNPRNTSRDCSHCNAKVFRHSQKERPVEYRAGAPLFTCPNGHKGNADLNASRNIGFRFLARHGLPQIEKPLQTPETVGCSDSPSSLSQHVGDEVAREPERASGAAL